MNTQESNGLENLLDLIEAEKMEEAACAWNQLAKTEAEQAAIAVRVLLALGQVDTAAQWLDKAQEDSGWLQVARCMVALANGDLAAARKHGNMAIASGIEQSLIYDMVAEAAEDMELYEVALQFYLRAQRSQKDQARLARILALMMRTGKTEIVGQALDQMEGHTDMDVQALRVLQACIAGDKALAAQHVQALKQDDSLMTLFARLQAGVLLEQDVSAQVETLKAADATLTDLWIADAYIARSDMARAQEMLDRVAKREENLVNAQHFLEMGRRYQMVGNLEKARAQLERVDTGALSMKRAMLARMELAHCLMAGEDKAKGLQMFEEINLQAMQALMQDPADTQLYLVRLRCYVEMGKKHEARELADFMMKIAKDDQAREMIRSAVK